MKDWFKAAVGGIVTAVVLFLAAFVPVAGACAAIKLFF